MLLLISRILLLYHIRYYDVIIYDLYRNKNIMFEGTSIQFVVDLEEVKEELALAELNWPILKVLDSEEEEEDRDIEDMTTSAEGVAIYIDRIDLLLKKRVDHARELMTTVARMIQYFNDRGDTAVLFFHRSWETYLVDEKEANG